MHEVERCRKPEPNLFYRLFLIDTGYVLGTFRNDGDNLDSRYVLRPFWDDGFFSLPQPRHQLHQITRPRTIIELRANQFRPGIFAGARGARHAKDIGAVSDTG